MLNAGQDAAGQVGLSAAAFRLIRDLLASLILRVIRGIHVHVLLDINVEPDLISQHTAIPFFQNIRAAEQLSDRGRCPAVRSKDVGTGALLHVLGDLQDIRSGR